MNLDGLHAERALIEHGTSGLSSAGVYELYLAAYGDEDLAQRAATEHALASEIAKAKQHGSHAG